MTVRIPLRRGGESGMRSIIVDDEESARARLGRMLAAHPDIVVVGEARDGLEAVEKIEELRPDLLFLDIEMPGLTGFEVLQSIPPAVPMPLVIFVTGYDQHALAAFDANALAYLLKPVEAERLAQAVDAHANWRDRRRGRARTGAHSAGGPRSAQSPAPDRVPQARPPGADAAGADSLVSGGRRHREGAHRRRYLHGELSARRTGSRTARRVFFRARREVLVNLTRIREIRPYFKSGFLLIMADAAATEIVVSERQARSLRQRIPRACSANSLAAGNSALSAKAFALEPFPLSPPATGPYLRCRRET